MLQPQRLAPAAAPPVNTNRAFNIHNMETLEAALQLADVRPPPDNTVDRVRQRGFCTLLPGFGASAL